MRRGDEVRKVRLERFRVEGMDGFSVLLVFVFSGVVVLKGIY